MTTKPSAKSKVRRLRPPFKRILCPTDISNTGNLAIATAYHLAADDGTVHVLHVCQPPFFGNPVYGAYTQGYVPTPEDTERGRAQVRAELRKLPPDDALSRGVRTEFHLIDGVNASRTIEEQVKELAVDVVVMSTHGRTGLSRVLMGSVATDVIKKQNIPVILVHQDGILD